MRALELQAPGKLALVAIDRPRVGEDQLLVRTGACVICTSDVLDLRENPFQIRLPVVMGHEAAGTVVELGRAVKGFRPGDRIAAHPVHPCRSCSACAEGFGHLCRKMSHFGIDMQGAMAEYFVVRADRARVVSEELDFAAAALLEPACVCLEAIHQARLASGQTLLILGDGPFGLIMARLADRRQLGKVVIAGHHDFRLRFAEGAVQVNAAKCDDPVAAMMAPVEGLGYHAVIAAVANPAGVRQGLKLLRPKGRLVLFAPIRGETPVDLFRVVLDELEIVGATNDRDLLDEALPLLADEPLALGRLVTHRFPLDRYEEAFELAATGKDCAVKVVITF